MIRGLRGLRAQLILWTILPLAAVLVLLSLFGISSHRESMVQLVEDRNRGLALAEASRLAREIDGRAAMLGDAARAAIVWDSPGVLDELASELRSGFPSGIARFSDQIVAQSVPGDGHWVDGDEARIVAARAAATQQAQFEGHVSDDAEPHLLIGVPLNDGGALVGAIPASMLSLAESSSLLEASAGGAVLILDATGRLIYRHDPAGLQMDDSTIADLPTPATGMASVTQLPAGQHELTLTYARIDPPGWTLAIAENVHDEGIMGMSVVEALPLLLLAVALVALMAVSFGVANVVRPLQELDRRAQRVAWGDFDAIREPVGGVQEMDDLRGTLAQMADRIRTYQAGMRDYLSAVTEGQEAERERLAHELHDETVQALIALRQRAQSARKSLGTDPARAGQRLDELTTLIDDELGNLRRLIGDLRPIYLEDLGFVPALEMLVKQIEARHGLSVRLDVDGLMVRLAPDLELAAFRIVQQAMANVAAHAHAHNVTVSIAFAADRLALTVADDGLGFTPPEQPASLARDGHFGLMGMRERALLYGGQLSIESAPGKGTTVRAQLPAR